jgi:hypothetical protein
LRRERRDVLRIAPKDFRGHWRSRLVAQQPDDDLLLPLLAVAVVPIRRQLVLFPLQITAGHVVQKQLRLLASPPLPQQPLLDLLLPLAQPFQIGV